MSRTFRSCLDGGKHMIDGTVRAAAVFLRFPADPQRKRTAHGAYPWAVLCLEGGSAGVRGSVGVDTGNVLNSSSAGQRLAFSPAPKMVSFTVTHSTHRTAPGLGSEGGSVLPEV